MTRTAAVENGWSCDGWLVRDLDTADSTNLAAANLPAWHAVRANRQTAGRGRFQRGWVSDEGGLWLSAVVPTGPNAADCRALPLAVGLAACEALRTIGLRQFRVRWPNDILVNDRKLAGILVEQHVPGLAVAGIGLNVTNRPETQDPQLLNQTTRLADVMVTPPSLRELTSILLSHLRSVADEMRNDGFAALLPRVNDLWGPSRRVELDLDGELRRGEFAGIGDEGQLRLLENSGRLATFHAHQVRHLKEID